MGSTAVARPRTAKIRWIALAIIVVALFVAARMLPVGRAVEDVGRWVDGLGAWGPVAFGVIYVAAALLLVPGSAITLAAGPLFGFWIGLLTVSLASTTAAALAFLIARYLAREKVAARVGRSRRFHAIDRAIAEGGAKVVALLRLSPAVPFSIGNYLFGLTGIRWVPYVIASWLFMLPGTVLYVYLGYAGARGWNAATGEGEGTTTAEWIALGVGLAATVAVTVHVTRLARRKLAEQTDISDVAGSRRTESH